MEEGKITEVRCRGYSYSRIFKDGKALIIIQGQTFQAKIEGGKPGYTEGLINPTVEWREDFLIVSGSIRGNHSPPSQEGIYVCGWGPYFPNAGYVKQKEFPAVHVGGKKLLVKWLVSPAEQPSFFPGELVNFKGVWSPPYLRITFLERHYYQPQR